MPYYWQRYLDDEGHWRRGEKPPGEHLSAMRRGFDREPGTLPEMWPFYSRLDDSGRVTNGLRAEHAALCLFGLHQQGISRPAHLPGVRLGTTMRTLRNANRFSQDAVDARFARAATASTVSEAAHHLRGLISMLKSLPDHVGLDYTLLTDDLFHWQYPERIGRVRRRWGADYFWQSKDHHDKKGINS